MEPEKIIGREYKEQPRIAVDGTEHKVRTADNKFFHGKLISTPIEFQRSPKKDLSPNKHNLRGPGGGGKYVSASERTRLLDKRIFSESRRKVRKVASDDKDSD